MLGAQAHFCSSCLSLGAGLQKGTQPFCLLANSCVSFPNSGSNSRPCGSQFRQPLSPGKMLPGKWCFSDPQNEDMLLTMQPQGLQLFPRPTSSLSSVDGETTCYHLLGESCLHHVLLLLRLGSIFSLLTMPLSLRPTAVPNHSFSLVFRV